MSNDFVGFNYINVKSPRLVDESELIVEFPNSLFDKMSNLYVLRVFVAKLSKNSFNPVVVICLILINMKACIF